MRARNIWFGVVLRSGASAALLSFASCAARPPQESETPGSISRDAEREIASLENLWASRPPGEDASLVEPTRRIIASHPGAKELDRLRLYLATRLFRERKLRFAEELLLPVTHGAPGIAQDEALILLSEIRIEEDRGDEALKLLEPLGARLLSEETRSRHAEAMVRAALRARRWRVSYEYLVSYVSETRGQRQKTLEFLNQSLAQIPLEAKRRLLESFSRPAAGGMDTSARETVQRHVVEELVQTALRQQDPQLARDLVDQGPAWVRRGERGEQLSLLATRAIDRAQVVGRLVGTVLGGPGSFATRRSVEAVSGMSEIFGDSVGLATEDQRDSISESLAALLGQGAGIIIAGVTEASALEALEFAELHGIPLITLEAPEQAPGTTHHFGFVLGPSRQQQFEALSQALETNKAEPTPPASSEQLGCDSLGSSLPSLIQRPKVWYVLGDRTCAERVEIHVRDFSHPPLLALGLEASEKREGANYFLRSGRFPAGAAQTESPPLFKALARDAARLAQKALTETRLPESTEPGGLRTYHEALRVALVKVEADLETTGARGFSGDHHLNRNYEVVRAK